MNKKLFGIFEEYYVKTSDFASSGVGGYESAINEIFNLTNNILFLNKFNAVENDKQQSVLFLTINNIDYSFTFKRDEYFDLNLLVEFNKIIKKENPNEERILVNFYMNDTDFGILFIDASTELMLAEKGEIWRNGEWIDSQRKYVTYQKYVSQNRINEKNEKFLGVFKIDQNNLYDLFKLTILELDSMGNFKGVLVENEEIDLDKDDIKVLGKIQDDKIEFITTYPDSSALLKSLMGSEKEFRYPIESRTIYYKGELNPINYVGSWKRNQNYIIINGERIDDEGSTGTWEMKRM